MKKWIAGVTAGVLLLSGILETGNYNWPGTHSIPNSILAAGTENVESGWCGQNITYILDSYGVLTVDGTGMMYDWEQEENVPWYDNRDMIRNVVIRNGVENIGNSAFSGCSSMTGIFISDSVSVIGDRAFKDCFSLTGITIPDGVKSIGDSAFIFCTELTEIIISDPECEIYDSASSLPENASVYGYAYSAAEEYARKYGRSFVLLESDGFVENGICGLREDNLLWEYYSDGTLKINGSGAMNNWSNSSYVPWAKYSSMIRNIELPAGLTSIGDNAFSNCAGLEVISVPDSVTKIGNSAFAHCTQLSELYLSLNLNEIGVTAFRGCISLFSVALPDNLKWIGDYAFMYCEGLEEIFIPANVTHIGAGIFEYCTDLKKIDVSSQNLQFRSYDGVLYQISDQKPVRLLSYPAARPGTMYQILDNTEYIGWFAFTASENLSSVSFPDTVKNIGDGAFEDCQSLRTVFLPESVETVNAFAFRDCTNLEDITIRNPDCLINDYEYTIYKNANIHGLEGSSAEKYAKKFERTFIQLSISDDKTDQPDESGKKSFIYGRDNWNFNNTKEYFSNETYRDQISQKYLDRLYDSLNEGEIASVFNGYMDSDGIFVNAAIDQEWGGSCYGMSALALLSFNGMMKYRKFQLGAGCLYDLDDPTRNEEVRSLITYYQMLQYKENIIQKRYKAGRDDYTQRERINDIIKEIERYGSSVVGYSQSEWGSHAVLAYKYEYRDKIIYGDKYDGCICICDPYNSRYSDTEYNIYFKKSSYEWIVPAYRNEGIGSEYGALLYNIGGNINSINKGGYLSTDETDYENEEHAARLDLYDLSDDAKVDLTEKKTGGGYMMQSGSVGDIVRDIIYSSNGDSRGIEGYNLRNMDSGYVVTQLTAHNLETVMRYEECMLTGCSKLAREIIFDKNGFVSVKGDRSDYSIGMVYNEKYPTDWSAVYVNGADAEKAELEMREDGYILRADRLDSVTVTARNRDITADVSFTTEYSEVFIYEIDEYTIGINADTDGDGAFDTLIAQSSEGIKGDVNADGKVSAADISGIKKCIIGSASVSVKKRADINESGDVDIFDLIRMKRNVAS